MFSDGNCLFRALATQIAGKTGHYHAVCRQRPKAPSGPSKKPPPQTNSLSLTGPRQVGAPRVRHPGMMSLNHADPAPTLTVHIKALNGQAMVEALPDSGADICAAGVVFLAHIKEHTLNLLPSEVKPRAVNGSILSPIGSLKAVISVGQPGLPSGVEESNCKQKNQLMRGYMKLLTNSLFNYHLMSIRISVLGM